MTVRKNQTIETGLFFITFTCFNWNNIIEDCTGYDLVYKQFDILKKEGHNINGFVIMPNHIHSLIQFNGCINGINKRIGTFKRFLAYDLIEKLSIFKKFTLLDEMKIAVNLSDRKRGKNHQVFEPSFDCKLCLSDEMVIQKLDYMHTNPCKGRWNLVIDPIDYIHSSARYYLTGEQSHYEVTHFRDN